MPTNENSRKTSFFSNLVARLKLHLFAPSYLYTKNQQIEELQKSLQSTQHHNNLLGSQISDLKGMIAVLNQNIEEQRKIVYEKTQIIESLKPFLSYSQTGEDRIIEIIFGILNIPTPSYLDVGANNPLQYSNTYLFYTKDCLGVCIEPDPELYAEFKRVRPKDTCLNIGIDVADGVLPLYIFEEIAKGLNTFSKEQADYVESTTKYRVAQVSEVSVRNINAVIEENFESHPNFLSLDVEGLDFAILQSLDLKKYPIEVICVETMTYGLESRTEKKITEIGEYMQSKGYFVFADTRINTIFVSRRCYTPLVNQVSSGTPQ